MANRTQPEFIDEVLERLGVLAAGQTSEVEDVTRIQELLPSVFKTFAAATPECA